MAVFHQWNWVILAELEQQPPSLVYQWSSCCMFSFTHPNNDMYHQKQFWMCSVLYSQNCLKGKIYEHVQEPPIFDCMSWQTTENMDVSWFLTFINPLAKHVPIFIESSRFIPSGNLTVRHGKSPPCFFQFGKPSISIRDMVITMAGPVSHNQAGYRWFSLIFPYFPIFTIYFYGPWLALLVITRPGRWFLIYRGQILGIFVKTRQALASELGGLLQSAPNWSVRHHGTMGPPVEWTEMRRNVCYIPLSVDIELYIYIYIIYRLKSKWKWITLLRVIPTMTFIHFLTGKSSGILSDISSDILFGLLSGISSGICSGISSGILSGKSSGILSGISSGILSDISSGILSGILSGISSGIYSDISSGILSGILSAILSGISSGISLGISIWQIFYMRSGREHLAWILAVEVRQGTLGVDGRGWGPAGNTGRGWSWLRSGREHWAWMVVVEVRQRTLCVEGRGWAGGGGEERRRGAGNWHKI